QPVGKSEDIVLQRMQAAIVVLGEELRFVPGHVHLHRALGLAGFAAEAKVERFVHGLALKALFTERARKHLPEQMGAAARRVLLVAGRAIARAHHPAFCIAARADADAALCRTLKRAAIRLKREELRSITFWGRDVEVAQVFDRVVDTHSIRDLARIHPVIRIPQHLELTEGLNKLGSEHLGQQRGARLAVAVFALERTAEAQHQVGSALNELAKRANTLFGAEVEVRPQMSASLAKVSIDRRAV